MIPRAFSTWQHYKKGGNSKGFYRVWNPQIAHLVDIQCVLYYPANLSRYSVNGKFARHEPTGQLLELITIPGLKFPTLKPAHYDIEPDLWARPLESFMGQTNTGEKRFTLIHDGRLNFK